jgi:hypothetical protein
MMRTRTLLALAALAALGLGGLAGCSKELRPIQNRPPETYLFVRGEVDTVSHRVRLYWFGTDPDGEVVKYAIRWVYPLPASQDPAWDTIPAVKPGVGTDSMFTMATGDSFVVMPRFEIFAIDNEGAADPTPAVQTFTLSNIAPTVTITNPLGARDSTYASATFSWTVNDPDGGGPGLYYRVWLDGNEAAYDSTTGNTFTLSSPRFLQGGEYLSGPRTAYVQAVDDGGRAGPPASMTWYVRAPAAVLENHQGRLLIVDEVPSAGSNNSLFDAFYKGVADLLPAGTYSVLRPQFNSQIFRSSRDVAQTLRQFRAVLWYRGGETTISTWLWTHQDSIGAWLDAGGQMYLDGIYLIKGLRTPGALREEFVTRHCGSTGLVNCFSYVGNGVTDSTSGWSFRAGSNFRSSRYGETARGLVAPFAMPDSSGGVRVFAVTDTSNVAVWAMDGQLQPPNVGFEAPVGVSVPQGNGGRFTILSLPIRFLTATPASNMLRRMLYEFGIGMPLP